jgi:pimeloyl-ACP methyl ester carboxylesterase
LPEVIRAWHGEHRFATWDAFLAAARADSPRWSEALAAALTSGMRERNGWIEPRVDEDILLAMVRPLQTVSFTARFPQLASSGIPTLLLSATEPPDQEDEREAFRRRFALGVPQAIVLPVPDCSHDLVSDGGAEIGRLIADWLATLT